MTKPPAKESRTKREDSLPTICFDLGDKVSLELTENMIKNDISGVLSEIIDSLL